jgi:hypothetical protein
VNTRISAKLTALAIALTMNSLIFGGVAILFNQSSQHASLLSLAMHVAKYQRLI